MDDHDAGHHGWWSMLQRVRAYAQTRNRGFVLCDAHTHEQYYDPDPDHPPTCIEETNSGKLRHRLPALFAQVATSGFGK